MSFTKKVKNIGEKGNSCINPLPDDKSLLLSKLKAFADKNFNVVQVMQFFYDRVENIVGKGENAGYKPFLLFAQCFFYQLLSQGCGNSGLFGKGLTLHNTIPSFNDPETERL